MPVPGATVTVSLPASCVDPASGRCGLLPEIEHAQPGVAQTVALSRLVDMFADTRGVVVGHKLQPLGESVSFDLNLSGFAGQLVSLVWTLHSASSGEVLAPRWYRDVLALQFHPHAADQSFSSQFWVPEPRATGSYFVQLLVYDAHGNQIAVGDSPDFS